jgi:hypothetical protein
MPVAKPNYLKEILQRTQELTDQKKKILAVFDLDSTLFDVSPRLTKILHDFADHPDFRRQFPESTKILKTLSTQRSDWGIKQTLIRAGLDQHHPEFHEALRKFWRQHFFSDEYLHFDRPYEGAVEYVQALSQAGADIVYLTGRDVHRMGKGSLEVLLKWNFPVDESRHRLVLKPEKGLDDAQFKSDWFGQQDLSVFSNTWFFENEPVNIHKIRADHPEVEVVFFSSTHSGRAEPPMDLPHIFDFLLNG